VLLIRNSKWSLHLFNELIKFAPNDGEIRKDEMKRVIKIYNPHIRDQNAFVYVINRNPNYMYKIYFEHEFYLNGYFLHYFEMPNYNPFIIHFATCSFCYERFNKILICSAMIFGSDLNWQYNI